MSSSSSSSFSSSCPGSSCRSRTIIKLFCSSLSKLVLFVALEDHGVDLGTIARSFGLDPSTLKLNGHFLSRGANLISSVTWKSLLSFFAARGFSTGSTDRGAVLVDGKACTHDPGWNDSFNSGNANPEDDGLGIKRKPGSDDVNLLKKRRTDQWKTGCMPFNSGNTNQKIEDDSFKRKPGLEDANFIKKKRMDQCKSGWSDSFKSGDANPKDDSLAIKRKPGSDDVNLLKKRKTDQWKTDLTKRKPGSDDVNLLKKRKTDQWKTGCTPFNGGNTNQKTDDDGLGFTRKAGLEDVNFIKKKKMDQCESGKLVNLSNAIPSITQFTCGFINRSLKRLREDEPVLTTTPSKR